MIFDSKLSFELDYSFFKLILREPKSKKGLQKISPRLFPEAKQAWEYLLRHARIEISKIYISVGEASPKDFSVRYKNLFSLFSALAVYLSKKTKRLIINESSLSVISSPEEAQNHFFDVNISAPLYAIIAVALKFFIIMLKSKKQKRRRLWHVGK